MSKVSSEKAKSNHTTKTILYQTTESRAHPDALNNCKNEEIGRPNPKNQVNWFASNTVWNVQ